MQVHAPAIELPRRSRCARSQGTRATADYTLDKQHAGLREHIAQQADFLGAIRLPADAFKEEGTKVVTDILYLLKRAAGETTRHPDPMARSFTNN